MRRHAFTLIELLVVIAIVAILAAILFPVFAQAKESAKKAACSSNQRQVGMAFAMYLADNDDLLPDRRDLKSSLPGGYRPWTSWPPSDPRGGWAALILNPYIKNRDIWGCPSVTGSALGSVVQVRQEWEPGAFSNFWLWRFDRTTVPTELDNFWGKSPEGAVADLQTLNDPRLGVPDGVADVELMVDPYFPRTIPSVQSELRGKSVHFGGRNRLFLDGHVKYLRDIRTQ